MIKKALVTGITGQDGSYLAELLLQKGYEVYGIVRRVSTDNTGRLRGYLGKNFKNPKLHIVSGDMTDSAGITRLIGEIKPHEIYNLAAQSHVAVSFEQPEYTANCDALGTLRLLEAIRVNGLAKHTKIYQASTSELYGKVQEIPQSETTPFYPRSPYGAAKIYGYWITVNYRESYGIFASNGILFNHESPLRGETFVTRKITIALARILLGLDSCLSLGNMDSKRDWGHAKDYVRAMWLILQQKTSQDFVIATGKQYTVRYFVELAARELGVEIVWRGKGVKETGVVKSIKVPASAAAAGVKIKPGDTIVKVDPKFYRPAEVETLLGNPSKSNKILGWKPEYSFEELVSEMAASDLRLALREKYLAAGNFDL